MDDDTIRVLYLDDCVMDRELVRRALGKAGGFELTEATNAQELNQLLQQGEYDLVLSDFNILGFSGLQILDLVKEKRPDLPVVIVTGTGSEEVAAEAIKRGAADYVIKNVSQLSGYPTSSATLSSNSGCARPTDAPSRPIAPW